MRNRRTPLMQILATFNASNDVSISKRTFEALSTHGVFKGSICQETDIITASPKYQTGRVQTPKILDCWWSMVQSYLQRRKFDQWETITVFMCGKGKERATVRTFTAKKQFSQITFEVMLWGCITWYGIGTLSFVDGNIEILGYTRGEFVASYCATLSYGWRNISRWWGTGAYGKHR